MALKEREIIYLHGFNSSPLSEKAQQVEAFVLDNPDLGYGFTAPRMDYPPIEAIEHVQSLVEEKKSQSDGDDVQFYFIGSSLGGYYAIYLADQYQCPSALINPAIRPYELLLEMIGEHVNPYTGIRFEITEGYVDDLKSLEVATVKPELYFLLTQTADETLDYRQGVEKFSKSRAIVEQGGNHAFEGFDQRIPEIVAFFDSFP